MVWYQPVTTTVSRLLDNSERTDIPTQTQVNIGNQLTVPSYYAGGGQSATAGYYIGGYAAPTAQRTKIQKMPFATEVFAEAGVQLAVTRNCHDVLSAAGACYAIAGKNDVSPVASATVYSSISKINTNTDAFSTLAATLTTARYQHASTGNSSRGVIGGGKSSSATLRSYEIFTYATEATSSPGVNLNLARYGLNASGTNKEAIFAGGDTAAGYLNSMEQFTYATNTSQWLGLTLSTKRYTGTNMSFSDYNAAA